MQEFRNKIKQAVMRFFQGRYGADNLSRAISYGSLAVYFAGVLLRSQILISIAAAAIFYSLYRMMSRDFWSRSAENKRYLDFVYLNKLRFQQRKTHRIFRCKGCGKNIRVPKGKGKIEVRCPSCGRRSIHRT